MIWLTKSFVMSGSSAVRIRPSPIPSQLPVTVTGGYNTGTGQVAARACGGGKCAEDHVLDALGGNKADVKIATASRPRPIPPPHRQLPVCEQCEANYGRDAIPPGTQLKSDQR